MSAQLLLALRRVPVAVLLHQLRRKARDVFADLNPGQQIVPNEILSRIEMQHASMQIRHELFADMKARFSTPPTYPSVQNRLVCIVLRCQHRDAGHPDNESVKSSDE